MVEGSSGSGDFRPRALLRYAGGGALAWWFSVLLALVRTPGASDRAFVGALFFVVLFAACWIYYQHVAFRVEGGVLTCRGFLGDRALPLSDVLKVEVSPGLVSTTYDVIALGGTFRFSSLFERHKELFELIVRGARLRP